MVRTIIVISSMVSPLSMNWRGRAHSSAFYRNGHRECFVIVSTTDCPLSPLSTFLSFYLPTRGFSHEERTVYNNKRNIFRTNFFWKSRDKLPTVNILLM